MKNKSIDKFFNEYFQSGSLIRVYTEDIPMEMISPAVNNEGWFTWKPIDGTFSSERYHELEKSFGVAFPKSYIEFHKRYFFLDGDCSILTLPYSKPNRPLEKIIDLLDNEHAIQLAKNNIYPFATENNEGLLLVFDGRDGKLDNEFVIRTFDPNVVDTLAGLGPVIFSSFTKLLECLTYYMRELKIRHDFDILPDFLEIDPLGAGKDGKAYWLASSNSLKNNHHFIMDNPWPS